MPTVALAPVPRYIRRLIHDTAQCHYQREEYTTAASRNVRYGELRGAPGLIRYSDAAASGIGLVYVVAWQRPTDDASVDEEMAGGMASAVQQTTGGRASYTPTSNLPKKPPLPVSMEMGNSELGKREKLESKAVSMETPDA